MTGGLRIVPQICFYYCSLFAILYNLRICIHEHRVIHAGNRLPEQFLRGSPSLQLQHLHAASFTFDKRAEYTEHDTDFVFISHAGVSKRSTNKVRPANLSKCGSFYVYDALRHLPCNRDGLFWFVDHRLTKTALSPRFAHAVRAVQMRNLSGPIVVVSESCRPDTCVIASLLGPCSMFNDIPPFTTSSDAWLRYIIHLANEARILTVDASHSSVDIAPESHRRCEGEDKRNNDLAQEKLLLGFASASRFELDQANRLIDREALRRRFLSTVDCGKPLQRGITVVTHASIDRLDAVSMLTVRWRGSVVLAAYMPPSCTTDCRQGMRILERLKLQSSLHYVIMTSRARHYPVNLLRNAAFTMVATEFFIFLDGDFVPSVGLYSYLMNAYNSVLLQNTRSCMVVPIFLESRKQSARPVPKFKRDVIAMLSSGAIQIPSESNRPHHGALNYSCWLNEACSAGTYNIKYQLYFEPYCVMHTRNSPWFDNRFVYYGFDKAQYALHLYRLGFDFQVLGSHFLIHMHHTLAAWVHGDGDVPEFLAEEPARLIASYIRFD